MQIIIAMSGFGERFRRAGYTVPKPLIEVNGKPIIAHVLDMFNVPEEANDVFFVCNKEHLQNSSFCMQEILTKYAPQGRICPIAPHKLGPVYAVSQIFDQIDLAKPTIVNYCDFTCTWDWDGFKKFVEETQCDGAVMCYTGFHPHMLGCFNYAYVRVDSDNTVQAIQEKKPYTDSPMGEYASSGSYYFKNAQVMKDVFEETLKREDLMLKGEYYVSLAYRPLLEKNKNIKVFEIEKFCQWGTPEDLQEWEYYHQSALLAQNVQARPYIGGTCLIPMAGLGSRFTKEGYTIPKPLIHVNSKPMVINAWQDLPEADKNIFVLRKDMPYYENVKNNIQQYVQTADFVSLAECTDGQARTCILGFDTIDLKKPLTIGACDNGLRYDVNKFDKIWKSDADVIVWTIRNYPNAMKNPEMYGWVDCDASGKVQAVSVKKALSNPQNDPVITGAFTFRKAKDFKACAERLFSRKVTINGEFYVDECINDAIMLGLNVYVFDVEAYLCWGTPSELKTYAYFKEGNVA